MSISPGQIPADRFADPAEAKRFGKLSIAERFAKNQRRAELKEQATFDTWLRARKTEGKLTFTHPRSDKPTTIEVGHLDFEIRSQGRCLMLEFKAPGGRLNDAQKAFLASERRAGNPADICYSAGEAIDLTRKWLNGERWKFANEL